MDACLETGVSYLDTANYEPQDEAKFEYRWQWEYQERFEKAGLMALLGSGFDPGVTNVFTAWLAKHHFDRMDTLDIWTAMGRSWSSFCHQFQSRDQYPRSDCTCQTLGKRSMGGNSALSQKHAFDFPKVGERNMYLMYHEELESLVKHFPDFQRAGFG